MKLVAFICNTILFAFTCLVMISEGLSREAAYIVFSIFLLIIPLLNMVTLLLLKDVTGWFGFFHNKRSLKRREEIQIASSTQAILKSTAITANIFLFGLSCWAFVSQYPHPEEEGFILYSLMVFLTPVISLLALVLPKRKIQQASV